MRPGKKHILPGNVRCKFVQKLRCKGKICVCLMTMKATLSKITPRRQMCHPNVNEVVDRGNNLFIILDIFQHLLFIQMIPNEYPTIKMQVFHKQ